MLSYLSAETSFIRAFGNRTLLLIILCALTRTVQKHDSASFLGLSVDLNPGIIVIFGPVLVLLFLIGLRTESNSLRIAREAVLAEAVKLPASITRTDRAIYALFWTPSIAAVFLVAQYVINVVPDGPDKCKYDRWRHFYEIGFPGGTPSIYCLHDVAEGMPWIYPPEQIYIYLLVLAGCFYLTLDISRRWGKARGGR